MAPSSGIYLFGGTDEILEFGKVVNTVPIVLDTDKNIGDVMKAAHAACATEFVKYMTKLSRSTPGKYGHMYEWNMVGAPNAKLWKHIIAGAGRTRKAYFEFIPSKSIVPVNPKLAAVGVKKRHRFALKAAIMEYGMKVTITPKLAKALVYLAANANSGNEGGSHGKIWQKNGIIYNPHGVTIQRQGNPSIWGSFTAAYVEWWSGEGARITIEEKVIKKMTTTISKQTIARMAKIGKNPKKIPTKVGSFAVTGADPELEEKLIKALYQDFLTEALNRTVI